jgi:transcription antitermination factor NusG
VECFLPLYETTHRWRNGQRQRIQLALFPSYVFVHIALQNRLPVLQAPGVVNLVSFHGAPAPLPELEVAALRNALAAGVHAEPYPYVQAGQQVEIACGYLQGLRGTVLRTRGRCRVVLSVDLLRRSIVVDIDAADLSSRRSVPIPRF